jgi:hypothetical protein
LGHFLRHSDRLTPSLNISVARSWFLNQAEYFSLIFQNVMFYEATGFDEQTFLPISKEESVMTKAELIE